MKCWGPLQERIRMQHAHKRTLAAAVLETVLTRKMETVRQQQGTHQTEPQGGTQVGIVVDPTLAADIVATADALAEDVDHINDVDDVDTDDIDNVDDLDLDID